MPELAQVRRTPKREAIAQVLWLSLSAVIGQVTLAALASFGALLMFAFLAHDVAEGATNNFDVTVVHAIHSRVPLSLHQAILSITFLANGPTIAAVLTGSVLLLILSGRIWPDAGALLLSGFGGYAFVESVKLIFHRPRPDLAMGVTGYSFPSGHSFLSTAVYGMLAYYLGLHLDRAGRIAVWVLAAVMIACIGSSRVLLGVHYPSDVLAGFASGTAWLWVCLSLRRVFAKRNWHEWRDERLSRLGAALRILDEVGSERHEVQRLSSGILGDSKAGVAARSFAHLGRIFGGSTRFLARHWGALSRHPYDLVVEGAFLRQAVKGLSEEKTRSEEVGRAEHSLRQLWTAQRGLFGLKSDEPYAPSAASQ